MKNAEAGSTIRSESRGWLCVPALLIGCFLAVGLVPARLDAEAAERVGLAETPAAVQARTDLQDDLLALTNADRTAHGLQELEAADRMSRYAARHSGRMAKLGAIFHSRDDQLRAVLEGSGWSVAGENVGVDTTLESIQRAFMQSAPHRHNVLNGSFDHAAIGIVEADGVVWVTVIFYGD